MKKRLRTIWMIQGLLIVLLIGCFSQLAIPLIRCTSIKLVKYEAPDASTMRIIEPGPLPVWIRYNGEK